MKVKKGLVAGTAMLALTALLAACGGGSKTTTSKDTWTRMTGDVIATMDPSLNTDTIGGQALVDTMEGLYRYKGKKLEPALAKEVVEPTNDGLTYTFKLRKSKWSDGKALTAKDFVYGWQRTVDPATKSQYAYLFSGILNADDISAGKKAPDTLGVKAVDDYTFEVTLAQPIPYFNTLMVNPIFFPQSKATVDKNGSKYGTNADRILTNGPYTLKDWDGTGNTWTETKNKNYWNAKNVHIENIKTQVVKDSSTALSLYKSGKLNDVTLSGTQATTAKTMADYVPREQPTVFYMELNEKKVPAFKNVKVRQAISMAINRTQFIKNVLKNDSRAATGMTPEGLANNPEDDKQDFAKQAAADTKQYTAANLTEAKKLFAEGLKETGVSNVEVALLGDDTTAGKDSAEYIQNALEKLDGLKVRIETVPFKTRLSRSQDKNFDMVMSGWSSDFPDPIAFLDLMTTNNSYNNGSWSSAEYDKLIQDTKTTYATAPEKRWAALVQAQELLTKEQGVVPIYQRVEAHLTSKNAKGITYSPANTYDYVGATLK